MVPVSGEVYVMKSMSGKVLLQNVAVIWMCPT